MKYYLVELLSWKSTTLVSKVRVKNVERNVKIKEVKFNEILLYYSLLNFIFIYR